MTGLSAATAVVVAMMKGSSETKKRYKMVIKKPGFYALVTKKLYAVFYITSCFSITHSGSFAL